MSNETEHRFQQRGRNVQTRLTSIATSMQTPPDQQEGWVLRTLEVLQDVMGRLNESVKAVKPNSIEEVSSALSSGETRTFFEKSTNKFNINYDIEYENQEDKDNFEEVSKVVDELFENVKGMVQDNWIMQREEEERRLSRSRLVFEPTSQGIRTNLSRGCATEFKRRGWTGWSNWTGGHDVREQWGRGSKSRGL